MRDHRKLHLMTAGRVVLTSLLTTFFSPVLLGVVLTALKTAEGLSVTSITPYRLVETAPGFFGGGLSSLVFMYG